MKINSEKLFEFVNNLGTDEKVKFKVFEDDNYVTEIYWDGENFNWEPGTFTSGMLFDPLVDFVEIEEESFKDKIRKIEIFESDVDENYAYEVGNKPNNVLIHNQIDKLFIDKFNEIIDKLNSMDKE